MPLLLDEDYEYLEEIGQRYDEDEGRRFLVLRNFRLQEGVYAAGGAVVETADILLELPLNYNLSGGDMFWVSPYLTLSDGTQIIAANQGADPRHHGTEVFERWSRHWHHLGWRARVDNLQTLVDRVTWALQNPDPRAA